MKYPKKSNSNTPISVRIAGFIFYPFYSYMGLLLIGFFLFPNSVFTDIVLKPVRWLLFESSENWEGCWEGTVEHRYDCYLTTYEELSLTERTDVELQSDVYSIDGSSPYQVTREVDCSNAIKGLPPYVNDLKINRDSNGFYFTWQDKKGYLNLNGGGSVAMTHKNDSLYQLTEFLVRINIDSDTLKFNSSITVYAFDELQYISHSTGRFIKKIAPCGDGIRFLED